MLFCVCIIFFLYNFFVVDAHNLYTKKDDTSSVAEGAQLHLDSKVVSEDIRVDHEEGSAAPQEAKIVLEEKHKPHITVEEEGGHFHNNKDTQPSFGALEEIPSEPQDTLENPVDVGLGGEVEHSHSGWSTLCNSSSFNIPC